MPLPRFFTTVTRTVRSCLTYFNRDAAPDCVKDIIQLLQKQHGLKLPESDEEWIDVPRTSICVRRSFILKDGLKEAGKSRFDPAKLLKVRILSN